MKVKGKVCVVTGAAGGIGEAIARRYAKEGAKGVVVADRDAVRLDAVAKDIGGLAVAGDIGTEAEVKRLIAEAEKKYGPVDVFFSNAGIGRGGVKLLASAGEMDATIRTQLINVVEALVGPSHEPNES